MMYLAVSEDDIPKAESLVARAGKDYADSTMFAVAKGDTALVARLLKEAKGTVPIGYVGAAVWQVGQWLHRPAEAEPFLRTAAARPERTTRIITGLADNQAFQGRWLAADSVLDQAYRQSPDPRLRVRRGFLAALPFLVVPRPSLETIRNDIAGWDPGKEQAAPGVNVALLGQTRHYVLGLLESRLGHADAALKEAGVLETVKPADDNEAVWRSLAAAIRADVALGAHRPADAIKALEVVRGAVPLDLNSVPWFSEDYARYLRAEALLATGNDQEALRWFANGFSGTADEVLYRARVSMRLGDLYERKGERQKAIDEYSTFVRVWARCDEPLKPEVEEARARLAKLTGEPR